MFLEFITEIFKMCSLVEETKCKGRIKDYLMYLYAQRATNNAHISATNNNLARIKFSYPFGNCEYIHTLQEK